MISTNLAHSFPLLLVQYKATIDGMGKHTKYLLKDTNKQKTHIEIHKNPVSLS